ncbi:MAG: bifunctional phosphoribosylaminoimidazolecarboxamide formyltransferase/IMP cyclohydrolase [Micavibrio aeruginosavorus]|nr:bifunctional phosphoribosylaminoimidazolecarboxamide formyltransferase/IMP cyclohydrolase [Micavibrio aeruginosavorus]
MATTHPTPAPQPAPDASGPRRALISVSDKAGLAAFARDLHALGMTLLSTGGTAKALGAENLPVTDVGSYTGFPEIMDGRVKTLHPRVHGGILARRDDPDHIAAMDAHGIAAIDLVVINLYPFAATVQAGKDFGECIENIDIGGPAMIRAAAKNHAFVTVVTDPADYPLVIAALRDHGGIVPDDLRRALAAKAFSLTAAYDSMIASWLAPMQLTPSLSFAGTLAQTLRYGENPHQAAALYRDLTGRPGVATAWQIQGKELSFNNLGDTDAAFELVAEFEDPAIAIIKHANPCGVALGTSMLDAYHRAFACDPVSAFGGIIALNRSLDAETAQAILGQFCEVIIAPDASAEALEIVRAKPNIRVLLTESLPDVTQPRLTVRTISGGLLVQGADTGRIAAADLKVVTRRAPTEAELRDLLFAFRVCKHVKSNAIVYAQDGKTVGIGAGQMSRVDSCRIAAWKMQSPAPGMVVASDAFFPFADGLLEAVKAGATAVIQPGGSIRDDEVIKAADDAGIAMVFTGMRHFRH